MSDPSLNRRMTVRLGSGVAFAQIGICGFDGTIELESLRLYGLPGEAPALLCGTPTLPVGTREFQAEVSWTCRRWRPASPACSTWPSSTQFIELDATAWTTNTVRMMAGNISAATFDLAVATLSVGVARRQVPRPRLEHAIDDPKKGVRWHQTLFTCQLPRKAQHHLAAVVIEMAQGPQQLVALIRAGLTARYWLLTERLDCLKHNRLLY
jgi:hypothetical protein